MNITRDDALMIMRRIMDRVERDNIGLSLNAGADEIIAALALVEPPRERLLNFYPLWTSDNTSGPLAE